MDTITVATQQVGANTIQTTVDNLLGEEVKSLKPKPRVIEIQAQEVEYQTIVKTKIDIYSHKKVSLRWKWIIFVIALMISTTSIVLILLSLYDLNNLNDQQILRIQDSFYWYLTTTQALNIVTIIIILFKFVYFIKDFSIQLKLSIKTSSFIISLLISSSIVSWALYKASGLNKQKMCAEDRFLNLDNFYIATLAQLKVSCCPQYPSYVPQWTKFFSCRTNGTDTNCLNVQPSYIQGFNIPLIDQITQLEQDQSCVGICSKGPFQLLHHNGYMIGNRHLVQIFYGNDQDYYRQNCMDSTLSNFQKGLSNTWKENLGALILEFIMLLNYIIFYIKIRKLK